MSNREHNRQQLTNCNALGWWGQYEQPEDGKPVKKLMPLQLKDGIPYTPSGLRCMMPRETRDATLDEILDHMDKYNLVATVGLGFDKAKANEHVS